MLTQFPSDRPWKRANVHELTQDDLDSWLQGIRERRLAMIKKYKEAQALKDQARTDELREVIEQQLRMMDKDFTTLDNACKRIEGRLLKCQVARLELGELLP